MRTIATALLFALIAAPALAQSTGFGSVPFFRLTEGLQPMGSIPIKPTDEIGIYRSIYGTIYNGTYGLVEIQSASVPIDRFASRADLDTLAASISRESFNSMAVFAYAARRDAARAVESAALAAAMTVVPPNPGDRFSFTVSGAALDGASAGSVSFSYRAADNVLLFGGYARGATQNLVKGGASFSFR